MANIKSQKKRIITNEKARERNVAVRSEVKTYAKKVVELSGDAQSSENDIVDALRVALRRYDKAVSKGVIKKRNAANKKSKLSKMVNRTVGERQTAQSQTAEQK
jgi:small subunit ribosomal protein S20